MRKHIKIRAELIGPANVMVKITLLEQSHFGHEFGYNARSFMSSCGIRLYSIGSYLDTSYFRNEFSRTNLFLPAGEKATTSAEAELSIHNYKRVKKAIEEYNAYEFTS